MLLGTVIGVLIIPGLYYLFGKIADGRKLLNDETDEPLSEMFQHNSTDVLTAAQHDAGPAAHQDPEGRLADESLPEATEIPDPPPTPPPPSREAGS
jgi:hypothetical protein